MHSAAAAVRTLVSRAPLFAHVERAVIDKAFSGAIERRIAEGAVLFRQGEASERLHLITEGHLKMTRVTPDGSQLTIGVLGPGETAGCVAVFRKLPYPATAIAVGEVATLSWTRPQVEQMLAQSPRLGRNALEIVGERAERFLGRVQEIANDPAHRRVVRALIHLLESGSRRAAAQIVLATRQELADLAGVTLHTASRVIAELERRGVVEGGRRRIAVTKPAALRLIVEAKKAG